MSLATKQQAQSQCVVANGQVKTQIPDRPRNILDEDEYIDGLAKIIKRDFFPGLTQLEQQHEYIEALDSKDITWIQNVVSKMVKPSWTPRAGSNSHFAIPDASPFHTPSETPSRIEPPYPSYHKSSNKRRKINTNLSLDQFQANFTSEDNASFWDLIDAENMKRRQKCSWLYDGTNRIYKESTIKAQMLLLKDDMTTNEHNIGWIDRVAAGPNGSVIPLKNALMFAPEGIRETPIPSETYRQIRLGATHMPTTPRNNTIPSPSSSTISRAIRGAVSDDLEPRVNGYTFVDTPATPIATHRASSPPWGIAASDQRKNPFKLPEIPKRDLIHERIIQRTRSRKPTPLRTPNLQTPVTGASPSVRERLLTPAGHRMLRAGIGLGSINVRKQLQTPKR